MTQFSKADLATDITSKVFTNVGRLIKGNTVRDRMLNMLDSTLNKTDDADNAGGYLSIDNTGIANISLIKKLTPTGQFLSDDGTWQSTMSGDFIPRAGTDIGSPILGVLEYGGGSDSTALAGLNSFYIGSGDVLDLDNWSYGSRIYFGVPQAGKFATINLSGPVTVIQNKSGAARIATTANANTAGSFYQLQVNNGTNSSGLVINAEGQIDLSASDPLFSGILGDADYSANYQSNSFIQKTYVDNNFIFYNGQTDSLNIIGTGGSGYLSLANQTGAPGTPSGATYVYSNASGQLAWNHRNGSDNYQRNFSGVLTANQTYTLQNNSGTLAFLSDITSSLVPYLTVASATATYMPFSGGTFTGAITLNADAVNPLQPVSLQQAVSLLAGYEQLQKGYDASTNLFPAASDTLPVVVMVKKGMSWYVTVPGTLGGVVVAVGDEIIALVDAPGQTSTSWLCISHTIGYAPVSNVLPSGRVFVGNASNVATGVTLTLSGTSGTFGLSNAGVFTFQDATTTDRGLLNSTDWNTFNNKLSTATATSTYIPYTGANASVNLGSQTLTTSGLVNVGNASANGTAFGKLRVGQGTSKIDIGEVSTGVAGMWANQTTNTAVNFFWENDGSSNYFNAPNSGSHNFYVNNAGSYFSINQTSLVSTPGTVASGANVNFRFTKPNNTNQTASAAINGFQYIGGSRQWATGGIGTQIENDWGAVTYSFVGASTINTSYGNVFRQAIAGANATITNNYAIAAIGPNVTIAIGELNASTTTLDATGNIRINAGSSANIDLDINTVLKARFGNAGTSFNVASISGGSTSAYTFVFSGGLNQVASTEINGILYNPSGSRQWATGALTLQRETYFKSVTYTSVGASIFTNVYGLYAEAATISTNVTATNNFAIGTLGALQVNDGTMTGGIVLRALVGTSSFAAMYMNQATPSGNNYTITATSSTTFINGVSNLNLQISGSTRIGLDSAGNTSFTPSANSSGAFTAFSFTKPSNTNQTLSTEIPGLIVNGGSRQWATGALTLQRENRWTTTTYSAVGASVFTTVIANSFEAVTAGTNITITNNYALGTTGGVLIEPIGANAGLFINGVTNTASGALFKITNSGGNSAFVMNNGDLKAQFYGGGGLNYPSISSTADINAGVGFATGQVAMVVSSVSKFISAATVNSSTVDLALTSSGTGFKIKSGAVTDRAGKATLSSGTVTVANTNVTANTIVVPTPIGSASGTMSYTINAGVGFTITSTLVSDSRVVSYILIELI